MSTAADSGSPAPDAVARVLVCRGSVREGIAMLRGAVARDRDEEACAALLAEVLAGRTPGEPSDPPALSLALVDRWIRRGLLVEALALLGGTPMGSEDTGREWANLLGELLAPVPVDAEETLVEMHKQLLTGGASVALVLLEERAKRGPSLPAWASRRLEVLRWMLLDNAGTAESHPELAGEAPPTALATTVREAVNARKLRGALEAVRRLAAADPADPDPPVVAGAIEQIVGEIERHADDAGIHARTIPMFGHPAGAMQLRMGNLPQASMVYRRLLAKDPEDEHSRRMIDAIDAVLRAARGEPVDTWAADTTAGELDPRDLDIPATAITALPEGMMGGPEDGPDSGTVQLGDVPEGVASFDDDEGTTTEMLSAPLQAERYLAEGRLEEAELLYRSLAAAHPDDAGWARRAEEVRALRGSSPGVVLVRAIRTVE